MTLDVIFFMWASGNGIQQRNKVPLPFPFIIAMKEKTFSIKSSRIHTTIDIISKHLCVEWTGEMDSSSLSSQHGSFFLWERKPFWRLNSRSGVVPLDLGFSRLALGEGQNNLRDASKSTHISEKNWCGGRYFIRKEDYLCTKFVPRRTERRPATLQIHQCVLLHESLRSIKKEIYSSAGTKIFHFKLKCASQVASFLLLMLTEHEQCPSVVMKPATKEQENSLVFPCSETPVGNSANNFVCIRSVFFPMM